ncbi:hypothetical protein IFO70_25475 [Phormidium tenue FACHB-886]|nr:hypothetical protein [Phormidium tenue FACHB-886]
MGGYQPVRRQEQQSRRQNFSRRDSRQPNAYQRDRYQSERYQNWRKPELKRNQAAESIATPEVKVGSGRSPVRKSHWLILVQLFKRYPLLLLLSVWLILLLMAGIAATTMMNLDYSKQQPSPVPLSSPVATVDIPVAASPPVASPFPAPTAKQSGTALSLLSLLGIALTCATGCVVLLRYLNPRRPAKRSQSLTSTRSTAIRNKSKATGSEAPRPAQSFTAEASVVPPEASHPLDWDEPSLADHLDLRQKQPLSRWL